MARSVASVKVSFIFFFSHKHTKIFLVASKSHFSALHNKCALFPIYFTLCFHSLHPFVGVATKNCEGWTIMCRFFFFFFDSKSCRVRENYFFPLALLSSQQTKNVKKTNSHPNIYGANKNRINTFFTKIAYMMVCTNRRLVSLITFCMSLI
jgi:hypothetical protein